jgi:hypothetical protein
VQFLEFGLEIAQLLQLRALFGVPPVCVFAWRRSASAVTVSSFGFTKSVTQV